MSNSNAVPAGQPVYYLVTADDRCNDEGNLTVLCGTVNGDVATAIVEDLNALSFYKAVRVGIATFRKERLREALLKVAPHITDPNYFDLAIVDFAVVQAPILNYNPLPRKDQP